MTGDSLRAEGLARQFVDSWRAAGLHPRPGAAREHLRSFEQNEGVSLPRFMLAYLLIADGTPDDGSALNDDRAIRFWPIGEIQVLKDLPHEGCCVFADYLLDSHEYGVLLQGPHTGAVVLVADRTLLKVAASMEEFARLYSERPDALFDASHPLPPTDPSAG